MAAMNSKIILAFGSLAGLMTGIVMKAAEEGRLPEMWPLKRAIFSRNRRAGKFCRLATCATVRPNAMQLLWAEAAWP